MTGVTESRQAKAFIKKYCGGVVRYRNTSLILLTLSYKGTDH